MLTLIGIFLWIPVEYIDNTVGGAGFYECTMQ